MNLTLDEIGLQYHKPDASKKYTGGDKLSTDKNFTKYYYELTSTYRDQPINMMEIGIFNGKSIAMWADYFINGTIYAVDINLYKFYNHLSTLRDEKAFENKRLTYIYGDQPEIYEKCFKPDSDVKIIKCDTTTKDFELIVNYLPEFTIIIDDGNAWSSKARQHNLPLCGQGDHRASSQYKNFVLLFGKIVSGGSYIIEDIIDPDDFYSQEHFGLLVMVVNQLLNVEQSRQKYIERILRKVETQMYKLDNTIVGLTTKIEMLNAIPESNPIKSSKYTVKNAPKNKSPSDMVKCMEGLNSKLQEKKNEIINLQLITADTIEKEFDDFCLTRINLAQQIDRIEQFDNFIVFHKK